MGGCPEQIGAAWKWRCCASAVAYCPEGHAGTAGSCMVARSRGSMRSVSLLLLAGSLADVALAAPRKLPAGLIRRDPIIASAPHATVLVTSVCMAGGAAAAAAAASVASPRKSRSPLREGPAIRRSGVLAGMDVSAQGPGFPAGGSGGVAGMEVSAPVHGVAPDGIDAVAGAHTLGMEVPGCVSGKAVVPSNRYDPLPTALGGPKASRDDSIGVDTLGVRRRRAPGLRAWARGRLQRAQLALASKEATDKALEGLEADVYAKSTVGPRLQKLSTLHRLARDASPAFDLLPVTAVKLCKIAAALKSARYRSADKYLRILKKEHILKRHSWSDELGVLMKDLCRSVLRGIGPPKQALAFGLSNLANVPARRDPCVVGGPICPVEVGLCMALWMLRGMEAASVLGEQAVIDDACSEAVLDLGATKMDTAGRGCKRSLVCACQPGALAICPVHALSSVLAERKRLGLGPKHPLFPQADGRATTSRGVCETFRLLLSLKVSEHSFRREGAQYYARQGVQECLIQFLGRWGSPTVKRYIGEALDSQASTAARRAAAHGRRPTMPVALGDNAFLSSGQLLDQLGSTSAGNAAAIVQQAVAEARRVIEETQVAQEARWARAAEDRLGAVVSRSTAGRQVHRIALGDGCVPPSLWATWCGWRFGSIEHVRVKIDLVNCKKCLRHV